MIGKLEELTLLATMRAGEIALPTQIYGRLVAGSRAAAFGAVYTTLGRLAGKRLLEEGRLIDDNGKERRTFTLTGAGREALAEALNATATVGGFDREKGWCYEVA